MKVTINNPTLTMSTDGSADVKLSYHADSINWEMDDKQMTKRLSLLTKLVPELIKHLTHLFPNKASKGINLN